MNKNRFKLKLWLKEPLVHFLVAGALLFLFYGYAGKSDTPADVQITMGPAQIERIKAAWEKQWRRLPTKEELQKLIEQFIQEEVLYREALSLGLEKDDTIVRRRLAQKMRFLIQDIADQQQPKEADLKAFFEENQDLFKSPTRISFTHVYFNTDRRGAKAGEDARQVLASLKKNNVERAADHGDPFMLHHDYVEISQQETTRLFGRQFAENLFALKPGPWQGPLRSGYGIHLIRIVDFVPERMPELEEVADRVRQEYTDAQRRKANQEAITSLKARYRIVIDQKAFKKEGHQGITLETSKDSS
jgi:parvulin-like peptidyl-prolyl isomerase